MAIRRKKPLERTPPDHGSGPDDHNQHRPFDLRNPIPTEDEIDESLAESFPASDPPSWTVFTRIGAPR